VTSRVGRAFVAVRDSEVGAESLGINLLHYKALAFGISGFYAGIAGGLYSALLNFVAPEGYDLFQMIIQKSTIVVGGMGSIAGSVIGASLIIVLLEVLREFKGLQEVAFGALLVGFVLFLRGGLISMLRRYVRGWEEPLRISRSDETETLPRSEPHPGTVKK
jgi:branched-chain amino acid transport system permease protein